MRLRLFCVYMYRTKQGLNASFAENTLLWLGDRGRVVSRDDGSGPCSEAEKAVPSALYGSSLQLDDDRISFACALLSPPPLPRALDALSAPPIAILDSTMDLWRRRRHWPARRGRRQQQQPRRRLRATARPSTLRARSRRM